MSRAGWLLTCLALYGSACGCGSTAGVEMDAGLVDAGSSSSAGSGGSTSACPSAPPHGVETVEDGGECSFSSCEFGYGDCDNSRANGCETLCPASGADCCSINQCDPGTACSTGIAGECAAVCSEAGTCVCSPFGNDPLYATCAEDEANAVWCPVLSVPYMCSIPVADPHYGCGPATDSNPPLIAPVGLICCPPA